MTETERQSERKEVKIKAEVVAFDYGNTLVMDPFEEIVQKIIIKVRDRVSFPFSEKYRSLFEISTFWQKANTEVNFPYASHFHQEEPIIQAFLLDLGMRPENSAVLAPEVLRIYRTALKNKLEKDKETSSQLRTIFEALISKGKKIVIISNDRAFAARSTFSWLNVDDLISEFITSEELGIEKPDPAVFEEAAKRLAVPLNQMVYVGDDPIRDIEAPKKIGMKAILFVPPEKYRKSQSWRIYESGSAIKPDAVIENLSDLTRIIV